MAVLCALILIPFATPAYAKGEGSVSKKLDKAIEEYVKAQDTLEHSQKRKKEIKDEISRSEKSVNEFSAAAYMHGGLPETTEILAAGSPDEAVGQISMLGFLGEQSGKHLKDLKSAKEKLKAEQDSLDDEISKARKAQAKMKKLRDQAATNLASAGGVPVAGPSPSSAPAAEPAPRNADGSLPEEGCSEDDPTTSGCITPRMLHTLQQAVIVGYQKETSCYRGYNDGGDHPKGKACDFTVGAHGSAATGSAKVYGDHVADWMVKNAHALGLRIVIWYNMIWNPLRGGWHDYDGGHTGDPNLDHTNHVHVSVLLAWRWRSPLRGPPALFRDGDRLLSRVILSTAIVSPM
jgi:chaperonin cofactor prefoldin